MSLEQSSAKKNNTSDLQIFNINFIDDCDDTAQLLKCPEIHFKPSTSKDFNKIHFFDPYLRKMKCGICHIKVILRNL